MNYKVTGWGLLGAITFAAMTAQAAETVESRLDALEKAQAETLYRIEDRKGRVRPFLSDAISFGGFFESSVAYIYGPDTQTQHAANSNGLALNVSVDFDEHFRLTTQLLNGLNFPLLNQHNDPRTPGVPRRIIGGATLALLVAQGYLEYGHSDAFKIQTGLGYVPFGVVFQEREYVLFRRRGGAQMLGLSAQGTSPGIVWPLWQGFHVLGTFPLVSNRWGYDAYTTTPSTNTRKLGYGGRLWASPYEWVKAGVSYQNGKTGAFTYQSFGADIDFKVGNGGVTAEYGVNTIPTGVGGPRSGYVEPYYSFFDGKFLIYVAADYLDYPNNRTALTATTFAADPYQRWLYAFGVNYLPLSYTRLRLGYTSADYVGTTATISSTTVTNQNRDFGLMEFSAGIAF